MNITEATAKACEQPTLIDALSWICVWETKRIIKRYKKNLNTAIIETNHGVWKACFNYCIENVMDNYKAGKLKQEKIL